MNALARLWKAIGGLADALERLAGMAHMAADAIQGSGQPLPLANGTQTVLDGPGAQERPTVRGRKGK